MREKRPFVALPRHPLTGKQFRVSARTERELAAYLHRIDSLRSEFRLGMISSDDVDRALRRLVHGAVTVERAAISYAARSDLAPNTARSARSFVAAAGRELAGKEVAELEAPLVVQWLRRLKARGASPGYLAVSWRTLRSVVRHAIERGWIGASPWGSWRPAGIRAGGARRKKREAARTVGELVALLEAAAVLDAERSRRLDRLPDLEAKIATAAMVGLRQGELAGLRWTDLDEGQGLVRVERQYAGAALKSARRVVRVERELFAVLRQHAERLRARELYDPEGPVFPQMQGSRRGAPRAYHAGETLTRSAIRRVVVCAGLPNPASWSAHSLRDTFASLEQDTYGGDLRTLADRTGHASLSSLVRYLHSRTREPAPPGFALSRQPPEPPELPPHPPAVPRAQKNPAE